MTPIRVDSVNDLLLQVSRQFHARGWALICTPYREMLYQFTVGLKFRFAHPELEVMGLPQEQGQRLLEDLVERVQAGQRFRSGDFFSDLIAGDDFFLVENPVDPEGPPLTGGRLRLIWPDARHRYPWQPDCDPVCAAQSLLIDTEGMDVEGLQLLLANSGMLP